jgi:hypothetical protein
MATVAGVDLGFDHDGVVAGVAFRLSDSTVEAVPVTTAPGELVEIHPKAGIALVLLDTTDKIVHKGHEAAQRALDIIAVAGRGVATLPRAHEECVLWWEEDGEICLRVVATKVVGVKVGPVDLQVTGPNDQIVQPPTPSAPEWTPALRFFRQAQAADDVFEAYRNTFLALEAILSTLVTGGPGREREWLEYALREVEQHGLVQIARYVQSTAGDAVEAFLNEQYRALRCATFHAKVHRPPVMLPGSLSEREQVDDALVPLTRLVMDLAEKIVKASYRSGGMTAAGFEGMYIGPKVGNMDMFLARHNSAKLAEQVQLKCDYVGAVDDNGFAHGFIGRVDAASIRRPRVRRNRRRLAGGGRHDVAAGHDTPHPARRRCRRHARGGAPRICTEQPAPSEATLPALMRLAAPSLACAQGRRSCPHAASRHRAS